MLELGYFFTFTKVKIFKNLRSNVKILLAMSLQRNESISTENVLPLIIYFHRG